MRLGVLSLILVLFGAGAAMAVEQPMRFPETGNPAFAFVLPDDWTASTDADDNMQVASRQKTVLLILSISPDATASLDDYAATMLKAGGADPASRKEAAMLAGRSGTTYYSVMNNPSDPLGLRVNIRLTLVKPDAGTVATCAFVISASATEAEIAAVQAVVNGMTIATK